MCFFEQTIWACHHWQWGHLRERCHSKECHVKLVFRSEYNDQHCSVCCSLLRKNNRISHMRADIIKFQGQPNAEAAIRRAEAKIAGTQRAMAELFQAHLWRRELVPRRGGKRSTTQRHKGQSQDQELGSGSKD